MEADVVPFGQTVFSHGSAYVVLVSAQGKDTSLSSESCSAWSALQVVANGCDW